MNTTENLKLPQYTEDDIFDLTVINEAHNKIDTAYKEIANFRDEIPKVNANAEIIDARVGQATLGDKIRSIDSQLDNIIYQKDNDDLEKLIDKYNKKNITLVLTKNHVLTSKEPKALNICNIIGNGYSITLDNVYFTSNKNVSLNGVKFYHKDKSEKTLQSYCLNLTNSVEIVNCYFRGFYSPCLIKNSTNNILTNLVFERCMQGVYTKNTIDTKISKINFNNTELDFNELKAMTSSVEGYDACLIEKSINTSITDSIFNWCIERALYSSDSENTTFTDNIINYSKGIKFCGYEGIKNNFIASNIIVNNSFDDAFCQLYQCKNVLISNVNISNDSSHLVGWLIRGGQNISDLYVSNIKANNIKRSVLGWEESFPTQLNEMCTVKRVYFDNVNCSQIGTIKDLVYPLFSFENTTVIEEQIKGLFVKNCIFLRGTMVDNSDINSTTKGFSYIIKANTITNVILEDNIISGYGATLTDKKLYPMLISGNYSNITVKADIKLGSFTSENLPSIKLTSRSKFNIICGDTTYKDNVVVVTKSINDSEEDISNKYIIERNIYNVVSTIFIQFNSNDVIYCEVFSDNEKGFIAYNGTYKYDGTNVYGGAWASDGKVRLYTDTDTTKINLRCSQTKQCKINMSVQSN